MWKWLPSQLTSRLLGPISGSQWSSKPWVTRPSVFEDLFEEDTNTLPPPVIRPGLGAHDASLVSSKTLEQLPVAATQLSSVQTSLSLQSLGALLTQALAVSSQLSVVQRSESAGHECAVCWQTLETHASSVQKRSSLQSAFTRQATMFTARSLLASKESSPGASWSAPLVMSPICPTLTRALAWVTPALTVTTQASPALPTQPPDPSKFQQVFPVPSTGKFPVVVSVVLEAVGVPSAAGQWKTTSVSVMSHPPAPPLEIVTV